MITGKLSQAFDKFDTLLPRRARMGDLPASSTTLGKQAVNFGR